VAEEDIAKGFAEVDNVGGKGLILFA